MELQYYGANCLKLFTKKAILVFDDNLTMVGLSSVSKPEEIMLFTSKPDTLPQKSRLVIDMPGEYEVADVSIQGIPARAHMDEADKKTATIYKIINSDIRLVILGHIHADLTDDELEAIGRIDVLIIPVGGNGYTLDGVDALKVIRKIEPKIIIPTHYADKNINYPVEQQDLSEALKGLAMEPKESVPKLKLKSVELSDVTQLVILERQ